MNQNIITYLNENKEKYAKDALIAELKKTGYEERDVAEGVAQVFDGVAPKPAPAKTSFWNFKDKKVYTKASEKWADFLFGFFVSLLAYIPRSIAAAVFLMDIAVAVYIFNRRRFMCYGMIAYVVIFPILFLLIFMYFEGVYNTTGSIF